MKAILGIFLLLVSCSSLAASAEEWRLILHVDKDGKTIEGDKGPLINTIRKGYPVRVGFAGRTVEHVTDAGFLTILNGEVYAQIDSIITQQPSKEFSTLGFRDVNKSWRAILSTKGTLTAIATGETSASEHQMATFWYSLASKENAQSATKPLNKR